MTLVATETPFAPPSTHSEPETWRPGLAHPRRRQILLVLCLSLLVVTIDNTVLNTALPTLARDLHASTRGLQWITDAYTLIFAALLVTAGALGDRFGSRRALLGGLVVFAAGSVGAALSGETGTLIAFRAVMGLGAAFVMPGTLSILSAVFPPAERPTAIGAWSAVAGVGIVIGPTLGGFLLDHFSWGSVFWVNVPLAALAIAGVRAVVPGATASAHHSLDPMGALLSIAGLAALVDAVIEAPDRGWLSTITLVEGASAVVLLGVFLTWELRSAHPMIDIRVFANRAFSGAAASVTLIFFALFGSLFALTQYLQLVHGYSAMSAGIRALPFAAAMGAMSPLSTLAAGRLGVRRVLPVGLALMAGGLFWLAQAQPMTPYITVMGAVVLMGAGMGLVMAPASTVIMNALPVHQAGAGSAVNDTVREVGGALGVAVIGSLVSAGYRAHLHLPAILPGHVADTARSSIAAADIVAQRAGAGGPSIASSAHSAFTVAMGHGFEVAAAVALIGAVVTWLRLPRQPVAPASAIEIVDTEPGVAAVA
ncbi:MAG: MFS transporter, partial [Acidimicrobiaceae bacterium]|nr:MFS transporter [Acidimicrobiaceae bacterium]